MHELKHFPAAVFARLTLLLCVIASEAMARSSDKPVSLQLSYTGDVLTNLRGGIRQADAYVDNLDLQIDIDADELWGLRNTQVFLYGLYNNGTRFSETIVGDAMVASNIETGVQAMRLYEAWVNLSYGNSGEVLLGLYDLNSEFDVLESSGLFAGSAHGIGADISQSGINGPSIFPLTSLALRLSSQVSDKWRYRVAILDGVPGDPENLDDTEIRLSDADGALLIGELERSTEGSKLLLGGWMYSADSAEVSAVDGQFPDATGRGNSGLYLRGESVLFARQARVSGFARAGIADGKFNGFSSFLSIGIHVQRPFKSRQDDEVGFAMAWAGTSSALRQAGADAGVPIESHETAIELTYRAKLTDHVTVQPNIQWIINPGLNPQLDNALVIGLRFEFRTWAF